MSDDLGFTFKEAKNGDVKISHRGKPATTLRAEKAKWFLQDMANADMTSQQQEMARITGNYKRGNERSAGNHPRNR
jgi:hypothetical protein